jgi:hypothetical protein
MGRFDRLVKQAVLNAVGKCATCGQPLDAGGVQIIGHQEDLWFVSLSCHKCHTRGLVAALIREQKEPEIITDLSPIELASASERSTVAADDVLDMHEFLRDFDGDFANLFERQGKQDCQDERHD